MLNIRKLCISPQPVCLAEAQPEKIQSMKQASPKLNLKAKKTRKQVFLEEMYQVVPWAALVELIAPYYPEGRTGRPPFALQTMLRVHFMQRWFFQQILDVVSDIPIQRRLLLKTGTVVDASLIAAPSSTKNKDHKPDPEMHSSKKGEQMYFVMKAYIGVDAESGLVHTVRGTSGNVHDVTEGNSLVHGGNRLDPQPSSRLSTSQSAPMPAQRREAFGRL